MFETTNQIYVHNEYVGVVFPIYGKLGIPCLIWYPPHAKITKFRTENQARLTRAARLEHVNGVHLHLLWSLANFCAFRHLFNERNREVNNIAVDHCPRGMID